MNWRNWKICGEEIFNINIADYLENLNAQNKIFHIFFNDSNDNNNDIFKVKENPSSEKSSASIIFPYFQNKSGYFINSLIINRFNPINKSSLISSTFILNLYKISFGKKIFIKYKFIN